MCWPAWIVRRHSRTMHKMTGVHRCLSMGAVRFFAPCCLLCILLLPSSGEADDTALEARFRKANEAYWAESYEEACRIYQGLVDYGLHSADLYFNLGNTYFRTGKAGLAVLYFEKALLMEPRADDIRSNLEKVREEFKGRGVVKLISEGKGSKGELGSTFSYDLVHRFTFDELAVLLLVFEYLFFILLLVRHRLSGEVQRVVLAYINVVLLLVTLAFGGLLTGRSYMESNFRTGVILNPSTSVRRGPSDGAKPLLEAPEGLKVRVLEDKDGWVRVRLGRELSGWVTREEVGVI